MQNKTLIKLDSVNYSINNKLLIEDISFSVNNGDMVSIIGPNGSGKSTLIKLITGELSVTSGNVFFNNIKIDDWSSSELAYYRSVLPQSNYLAFPFSVLDIVKMGRYPIKDSTSSENELICKKILEVFDLSSHIDQNYMTLSGGEKQRVQLARVFSQIWSDNNYDNRVLIIDEPTSYLDINHQCCLFGFLKSMNKKGLTIVMVLHDLNQAIINSNKIIMLKQAKLVSYERTNKIIDTEKLEEVFDVKLKLIKNEESDRMFVTY
ncbi:MAG: heme ABC transporter ATP-binding protein [Candidatus Marinimicrobia bacterium]|nr:heme ABC transporter ATP-binding protein [Candidatus Neomarinimicrobiota bacterium]|tara:strand:+ start:33314 stop:34102 length:789 start_codon:yes stop_codon:yes gene_type:complete